MSVPTKVVELVERFDQNLGAYRQGKYNETQVRLEFINPLFEELGWDIANRQGYAEAYKEVVHEDAVKVGGATKAPDYSFRIGGVRKFFLEAKKPSVDIKEDTHPAYQLRRYAWSAKLPISILTDFEEFAAYDCRVKPVKTDKPSHSRILYLTYTDYAKRWEEIAGIFSREAILKGSFDKYVESKKAKRGTAEVDSAFLQEIERWRDLLARNIALRNPNLSQRELNFAIQRTIDRIIFLRICEDRGIELYGRLMGLQNGTRIYQRLFHLFRQADDRYNSGLFHFRPEKERPDDSLDKLTPDLSIDDRVLKDILKNLYYPDSPYEFSVLPANILGQVYEQFLGKVIRLTPAHHAVVEDKPEVRKAGGVYYTPTYIVDYIVKQTVGKLVEGKKPGPRGAVSKLKILDPACGSGSFLLGAYQFLLDWHRDEYIKDGPEKWATGRTPRLYQTNAGEWKLTTDERKRILLNNIYGVDIDPQAVEVTKLSLLLKVLEGEDEQTIAQQLALFHQRVLPDLANNIKCGNSLIGPDFYDGQQMTLLNEEEMYRINTFDWQAEFPEIMKNGGFDAVIGNPPYVRQEALGLLKSYFSDNYFAYASTADLYAYFIEKGMLLINNSGIFGMIVSNKWMRAKYGGPLRNLLSSKYQILSIIDFGELPVFQKVGTFPAILLIKQKKAVRYTLKYAPIRELLPNQLIEAINKVRYYVDVSTQDNHLGWSLASPDEIKVLDKIKDNGISLKEYVGNSEIKYGIKTGFNKAFVIDDKTRSHLIEEDPNSKDLIVPFVNGDDIRKYKINFRQRYLILTKIGVPIRNYPAIFKYLENFKEQLTKRSDKGNQWWELRACDYYDKFQSQKIIWPDIAKEPRFSFDDNRLYVTNTAYILSLNDKYLLGILNSALAWLYFQNTCFALGNPRRGGRLRLIYQFVETLPIRTIDFSDSADKARYDQMVTLVERMLDLNKQLAEAKVPQAKTVLQRQIEAADRQIDELVYGLYGLTDEEIKIVEKSSG